MYASIDEMLSCEGSTQCKAIDCRYYEEDACVNFFGCGALKDNDCPRLDFYKLEAKKYEWQAMDEDVE